MPLFSRNWLFVDAALQRRLASTRLLIAGSGMGSVIARLAVRTGFGRLTVCDGDRVELSNLNRQAYFAADVGRGKADATADYLKAINPDVEVRVVGEMLTPETLPAVVADSDLIVNTIDWSSPAFPVCNEIAGQRGKTVLFPMNLGWGGALYVFAPGGVALAEMLGVDPRAAAPETIKDAFVAHALSATAPTPTLAAAADAYYGGKSARPDYDPQLGAAVAVMAALTVRTAVRLVAGAPVRTAPAPIRVDLDDWIAP